MISLAETAVLGMKALLAAGVGQKNRRAAVVLVFHLEDDGAWSYECEADAPPRLAAAVLRQLAADMEAGEGRAPKLAAVPS